jgi:hypothetical protein
MKCAGSLALILAGCGTGRPATPAADTTASLAVPADSLVLTSGDSIFVWLTAGRTGTASDGSGCREHGVRVGPAGNARMVPLLFVRTAPRFDGKGRLLATISSDCADGATYQIDPTTAQPTLLRDVTR